MTGLYIIPILLVLVLIHELGHFAAARLTGIRVQEFGLGIPPRLFGVRKGGVLYSINALPIGGFVRVLGEDGKSSAPDSLQAKSKARRALFFGAGSLMNLLLALAVITALAGLRGGTTTDIYAGTVAPDSPAAHAGIQPGDRIVAVAGTPVSSVGQVTALLGRPGAGPLPLTLRRGAETVQATITPGVAAGGAAAAGIEPVSAFAAHITVFAVTPGTAADRAGLRTGDQITRAAGMPVADAAALELTVKAHEGETIPVTLTRGGQPLDVQLAVPPAVPGGLPPVGFSFAQYAVTHPLPPAQALPAGGRETVDIMRRTVSGTLSVFTDRSAAHAIAGPIGIGQMTSEVLTVSPDPAWVTLARILAVISLSLSLLNLIPLPALDGGHLFFILIESLRGRPVPAKKEALVHMVGMAALLASMVAIAYFDIARIAAGGSLIR